MSARPLGLLVAAILFSPKAGFAQDILPYGAPISLEQAKKHIAAAEAEAKKHKWPVAIAIVDSGAHLVAFIKMDDTQLGSNDVALEKAKCAALFRRPTKVFEEALANGGANLRALKIPGVIPVDGGIPIIQDGKVIGAIGVSGVKPNEDGQVAQAAIDSLRPKP
jgi:glc operon protein GlcG